MFPTLSLFPSDPFFWNFISVYLFRFFVPGQRFSKNICCSLNIYFCRRVRHYRKLVWVSMIVFMRGSLCLLNWKLVILAARKQSKDIRETHHSYCGVPRTALYSVCCLILTLSFLFPKCLLSWTFLGFGLLTAVLFHEHFHFFFPLICNSPNSYPFSLHFPKFCWQTLLTMVYTPFSLFACLLVVVFGEKQTNTFLLSSQMGLGEYSEYNYVHLICNVASTLFWPLF